MLNDAASCSVDSLGNSLPRVIDRRARTWELSGCQRRRARKDGQPLLTRVWWWVEHLPSSSRVPITRISRFLLLAFVTHL